MKDMKKAIETGIGTDITNAIVSTSTRLVGTKPNRVIIRMRGPYPQSHVTLRYCGHVTNKKRFISTFTRPMNPKVNRW